MKILLTKKIYFHWFSVAFLEIIILVLLNFFNVFDFNDYRVLIAVILLISVINLFIYYFDFVKPFKAILIQIKALLTGRTYKRIFTNRTDELGIFAYFFNEVTESLEKVTEELEQSKRLSGELRTAGQLQKELIPSLSPKIKGFDICVKNRSAEELGGDNMDFINVKNHSFFYIGDVTGHGVPAAIVMTMVNTLINAFAEIYETAYEIVVNTNRRLKTRIRATMFMSMMLLKWDAEDKKMSYIGCGHEYLLVYKYKTGKCEATISGGIALGMVPDNSKIVKEKDLVLDTGDIIVLYTDGVTEARNMKGEMYGLDRLKQVIELYGGQCDAQGLVQYIAKDFSTFVEDHVQEDDVTLIAVRRLDDNSEGNAVVDSKQERWSSEAAK